MKYTIEGFSQQYAAMLKDEKQKIDCIDLVILRWFVDFKDTGKMAYMDIGSDRFYWVRYDKVLEDMPILSISRRALYDRMQKMVKFGVLKHHHHKVGGNFSYYALGENYVNLVSQPYEDNFNTLCSQLPNVMKSTSEPCEDSFRRLGSQLPNKNDSIKDSSFKDDSTRYNSDVKNTAPYRVQSLFNEICTSLPKVVKMTSGREKAVLKMIKDGITMEDFETAFKKAQESSFLKGKIGTWKANFDWMMNGGNLVKILEGNYDDRKTVESGFPDYSCGEDESL